jgi:hypothetical protein
VVASVQGSLEVETIVPLLIRAVVARTSRSPADFVAAAGSSVTNIM